MAIRGTTSSAMSVAGSWALPWFQIAELPNDGNAAQRSRYGGRWALELPSLQDALLPYLCLISLEIILLELFTMRANRESHAASPPLSAGHHLRAFANATLTAPTTSPLPSYYLPR